MANISKNEIALAGEFAVLSQLSLRGFSANMTLGNTKGVDILLSHPDTDSMYRLEVKTHFNNRAYTSANFGKIISYWRMDKKHEMNTDSKLFYCFVSIAENTQEFRFYIVPSNVVAQFVTESHIYWLKGNSKRNNSVMRKFMIGTNEGRYPIQTPFAEEYENKWELLK